VTDATPQSFVGGTGSLLIPFDKEDFMRRGLPAFFAALGIFVSVAAAAAFGQAAAVQKFPLTEATGITGPNVAVKAVEFKGRKAVLVTNVDQQKDGYALLPDTDFQDGTIEADIALHIPPLPSGVRMPGFYGIAFRARTDGSRYELFYLRPGNAHADSQSMRNHVVQYTSEPDFGWYKLRREWPFVYEAYAPLELDTWTHVKIEVKGRSARLYLNGSTEPALLVDGLRGQDLHGSVALWGYPAEEAYFSNVTITNAPASVKNGSDAAGAWEVKYVSDAGAVAGTLTLARDGDKLTGTWSGDMGKDLPVQGTWRDGYVEFTFPCTWMKDTTQVTAHLAGWVDGNSARGHMIVEGRADGLFDATKK
jgi:hypothetical protein